MSRRADRFRFAFVKRFERADKEDYRNFLGFNLTVKDFADFVAAQSWHENIGNNNIGSGFCRETNSIITVVDGNDFNIFASETLLPISYARTSESLLVEAYVINECLNLAPASIEVKQGLNPQFRANHQ